MSAPQKSVKVGSATLELVLGDITAERVDAIVNAANSGLRGGGGVDGAIHRAGGPAIMRECREIGHCATGDAVATTAGDLCARWVIHTAGPVWRGGDKDEEEKLASCYARSMAVAARKGARSVAFPSVSTGVYGYPVERAAPVALRTVRDCLQRFEGIEVARFVLFDEPTFEAYATALDSL